MDSVVEWYDLSMLVVLLVILALILFGAGFTIKWLFIAALVAVLLAIFAGSRTRI